MVLGDKWQTCDLTLVVQTETTVFFLGNKITFSSAVLIFDSRSMVALLVLDFPGFSTIYFNKLTNDAKILG